MGSGESSRLRMVRVMDETISAGTTSDMTTARDAA